MAKDRRSFFERLTGSISLNEEDYAEVATTTTDKGEWVEEPEEEGQLAVDVYQTGTEIIVQAMVAGVKPEDLNIAITREMVTIKGSRERGGSNADDYFQKELYWGSFARTILLPGEVEAEEADAVERNGLLTITLPKIDKAKIQKLKVKSM